MRPLAGCRSALRVCLAFAVIAGAASPAAAQQYFNGAQTTPNGVINGGGGVWDTTTANWTDVTASVSSAYDPLSVGTVFGSTGFSTPATAGTVTVAPGGVQLTGIVAFDVTGDNSIYTVQGGDLTLAVGGTAIFVADVSGTADPSAVIASRIVGSGGLSVQGAGILALTGASTYTGGTFICSCASLQLGDATHTASIVGDVTNEGYFAIVNANTSGITSILNDGSFGSPATTSFLNATTASSIAINNFNGGQTYFGAFGGTDTATAGNATITNDGGGTIFFARTSAGSASITNQNGGGMLFLEQSSAGSATIVNQDFGFTTFGQAFGGDAPTAGNATIRNEADGLTEFNAFSTAGNATIITNSGGETDFYDNSTGGNARFITNGTGIVDFGGSVGPNGDGRITAGSIEGSGTYYIGGGNTLVVGGNNRSTEVSGTIADSCGCGPGSGSLEKVGGGTLILSGANTYTGTTTVNGGILEIDGFNNQSSLTTVNAGGALYGFGNVGNTVIAGGGIFAPGDGGPGSSMLVWGNLAFQSGALYIVQVGSGPTASFAHVLGDVALNGTVGVALYPGSTVLPQYSIMQFSGAASGNFSGVAAPGGLIGTTTVDPGGVVYLNFALDWSAKFNLNINQQNVANTLVNFYNANGYTIPAAFAGLSPSGLTQASGEPATGSQQTTFNAMNLFLGLLTDPFAAGRGGFGGSSGATPFADETAGAYAAAGKPRSKREREAYAAVTKAVPSNDLLNPRWSVWAAGFGGSQTTDGNLTLGSTTVTSRVIGTAVGVDYLLSPRTIAGFALAGGGTSFSLANSLGGGRSDLFQAGVFVHQKSGAAYVTGGLAYGRQDVTTDRTVTAAGADHLRAEFKANAFSGRLEGGYRYATPWMGITPYAAAQFTSINLPGYAETAVSGANTFAAAYAARSVTDTRSELGVRTDKSFARPDGLVTLRGRLAWAHDFNPDRNVSAVFQTLPGTAFVVNGAAQARDSALTTASAEMKWLNGWSAVATFEGEFSRVTNSYAGKGVVRYAW